MSTVREEEWRVPSQVAFTGGSLLWRFGPDDPYAERPADLLCRFQALGDDDTEPQVIAEFAAQFGVLKICKEHALPTLHVEPVIVESPRDHQALVHQPTCAFDTQLHNGLRWRKEPIREWRLLARQAKAIGDLASALRRETTLPTRFDEWERWKEAQRRDRLAELLGPADAWGTLGMPVDKYFDPQWPLVPGAVRGPHRMWWRQQRLELEEFRRQHQATLSRRINSWLRVSGARPETEWTGPLPHWVERVPGLFAGVSRELADSLVGGRFLTCAACGRPFPAGRRAHPGEAAWCSSTTCRGAKERLKKQRQRSMR